MHKFRTPIFFIISGGTASAFQLGVYILLSRIFGLWYLFSSIIAFSLAVILSFTLQKFVTFRDRNRESIHTQFAFFLSLALFNLAANAASMLFLVEKLGLLDVWAQVLTLGMVACWSFFFYRHKIFRKNI